jgi:hypothetical protein
LSRRNPAILCATVIRRAIFARRLTFKDFLRGGELASETVVEALALGQPFLKFLSVAVIGTFLAAARKTTTASAAEDQRYWGHVSGPLSVCDDH